MDSNSKAQITFNPDNAGITLPGADQAVLCLHGFTATPQTFSELARAIHQQTSFHTIAPLLPGHGTVYTDLDEITYKDWITFAQEQYQKLLQSFSQIHLVGLSMGATLCQILSQKYPATTQSISMMAPALRLSSTIDQLRMHIMQYFPQHLLAKIIKQKKESLPGYVSYSQYSVAAVKAAFVLFRYCEKNLQPSHIPCLIQTAENDPVIDPYSSKKIATYYTNIKQVTYPETPHVMVFAKNKQQVFDRIISHIEAYK
ncbi:MAG: alpha/beta fold hydrolase [Bdellovibrionota bacterium]|nr:alpha/beta fold hydrolase [Deltaproteobacteria bacterium]